MYIYFFNAVALQAVFYRVREATITFLNSKQTWREIWKDGSETDLFQLIPVINEQSHLCLSFNAKEIKLRVH